MSLYNGAKTRLRVGSVYSKEFEIKVGVHQESVLSPQLLVIVVDVITENASRGVVNELRPNSHEQNHKRLERKI